MQNKLCFISMLVLSCAKAEMPSNTQIVGGETVSDSNDPVYRSTVALIGSQGVFCTGTLVGPNQITTAAHCIHPEEGGQVGLSGIGFGTNAQQAQGLSNFKVAFYPRYQANNGASGLGSLVGDIGLITFSGSVPSGFGPVEIADASAVQQGTTVVHSGYGMTESERMDVGTLRKVESTLVQISQTGREFETNTPSRGTCQGDSGGPTFIQQNGSLKLIGATSRGPAPCSMGQGIYSFVSMYQGWLKCGFEKAGAVLSNLKDDASSSDCSQTQVQSPGQGAGSAPGSGSQPFPGPGQFPDDDDPFGQGGDDLCPPGTEYMEDPVYGPICVQF